MPRLCELYPGIWLTTEEKRGKISVTVAKTSVRVDKCLVQIGFLFWVMTGRNIVGKMRRFGMTCFHQA